MGFDHVVVGSNGFGEVGVGVGGVEEEELLPWPMANSNSITHTLSRTRHEYWRMSMAQMGSMARTMPPTHQHPQSSS